VSAVIVVSVLVEFPLSADLPNGGEITGALGGGGGGVSATSNVLLLLLILFAKFAFDFALI
jgi:hypothetical protein